MRRCLSTANRNSDLVIGELLDEKQTLTKMMDEAKSIIKQQEDEIDNYRKSMFELTEQLSRSHSAREDSVFRAKR